MYRPSPFAVTEMAAAVDVSVMVMVAPGTAAPDESVITPVKAPVVAFCAFRGGEKNRDAKIARLRARTTFLIENSQTT